MPLELSELTLEEALRSYSSVKGHRTRVEKDIGNLVRLLTATYSEDRLNDRLEKLQTYTHRLSDIAEYLWHLNSPKLATIGTKSRISKKCWISAQKMFSEFCMNVTLPHLEMWPPL